MIELLPLKVYGFSFWFLPMFCYCFTVVVILKVMILRKSFNVRQLCRHCTLPLSTLYNS